MLVAHDRWFLEAVATAVLELEAGRSRLLRGPVARLAPEKAARELRAGTGDRAPAGGDRAPRAVRRALPLEKSKARQAQAQADPDRPPRADGAGSAAAAPRRHAVAGLRLPRRRRAAGARRRWRWSGLTITAGERTLLADVELWLERGEHVSLVGPNGAGKTTLIETLLAQRDPPAAGKLAAQRRARRFLSQQDEEIDEAGHGAPVRPARDRPAPGQGAGAARSRSSSPAGRRTRSGRGPVRAASGGGSRSRSSSPRGANFLVLDEPTNHLDLESREALEDALRAFPGTVLLVSHDRALLDAVATRILAIEDGRLRSYDGGWADFTRDSAEATKPAQPEASTPKAKPQPKSRPAKARPSELELIEGRITACEQRVAELERALAEDWGDVDRIASHREARREAEQLLARWEELFEQASA